MDIRIAQPGDSDFQSIARLHSEGITEGFLSTLGLRFLSSLYRGINEAPLSGLLVAKDGSTVLGFAAYTGSLSGCYRWLLTRRFIPIAFSLLPNALNLSVYKKSLETLLYPLRGAKAAATQSNSRTPRAELLSIAVSDAARGHGIGKRLIGAVDEAFRQLSIRQYFVVTHGVDARSNSFYQTTGFRLARSFTNHGKPMNEYTRALNRE